MLTNKFSDFFLISPKFKFASFLFWFEQAKASESPHSAFLRPSDIRPRVARGSAPPNPTDISASTTLLPFGDTFSIYTHLPAVGREFLGAQFPRILKPVAQIILITSSPSTILPKSRIPQPGLNDSGNSPATDQKNILLPARF